MPEEPHDDLYQQEGFLSEDGSEPRGDLSEQAKSQDESFSVVPLSAGDIGALYEVDVQGHERTSHVVQVVDEMVAALDLAVLGPGGLNLPYVRRALDLLAEASRCGYPINSSTALFLSENGWQVKPGTEAGDDNAEAGR